MMARRAHQRLLRTSPIDLRRLLPVVGQNCRNRPVVLHACDVDVAEGREQVLVLGVVVGGDLHGGKCS